MFLRSFAVPFLCSSITIALFQSSGIVFSLRQAVNKFENFWWMIVPASVRRSIAMFHYSSLLCIFSPLTSRITVIWNLHCASVFLTSRNL